MVKSPCHKYMPSSPGHIQNEKQIMQCLLGGLMQNVGQFKVSCFHGDDEAISYNFAVLEIVSSGVAQHEVYKPR